MKKSDLIAAVAEKTGFTRDVVSQAFEGLVEATKEALKEGESVPFGYLGLFKIRETKERNARNPKTGETIKKEAGQKLVFKPSVNAKEEFTPKKVKK